MQDLLPRIVVGKPALTWQTVWAISTVTQQVTAQHAAITSSAWQAHVNVCPNLCLFLGSGAGDKRVHPQAPTPAHGRSRNIAQLGHRSS